MAVALMSMICICKLKFRALHTNFARSLNNLEHYNHLSATMHRPILLHLWEELDKILAFSQLFKVQLRF